MQPDKMGIRTWALVPLLIGACAAVWLAADGRLHWDEPSHLYAGVYQSVAQIIAGDVQPSGIPGFSQGRVLHALMVKGVMSIAGSGATGFKVLVAINLALTICSLVLIATLLRDLLSDTGERHVAIALLAMTPVILYMSFKTLGDNEALLAALVATKSLLDGARTGRVYPGVVATVSLAVAALSKNQMIVLPAAFWVAMCMVPIAGINRQRLAIFGTICGSAGFLLTIVLLEWLGIGVAPYLSSYGDPLESVVPLVAKFVNVGTELGALWLLLPFALLSPRRKELVAFLLWFLFATVPFVLVFRNIEARHIVVNLVAVGGLFALAFEAMNRRLDVGRRFSDMHKSAVAALAVVVLMGSNALTLAIMPHRVDLGQLREMLLTLDRHYGAGRYSLLSARGYTDFHIVRTLWPEVDVMDVGTDVMAVRTERLSREKALDQYMGDRHVDSLEELVELRRPLVYFGYRQTFAAENMRTILNRVSPGLADRLMGSVGLVDHLYTPETRWLWGSADVRLVPVAQVGHYLAFEVLTSPM